MEIFRKSAQVRAASHKFNAERRIIGFVPTMGALHAGHISLIEESKKQCDITVCSIFVNPTQFNDPADLERYPRTPEKDLAMLEKAGCDAVFMPPAEEIYPEKDDRHFDFGLLDKVLEGEKRPGHFNGVAQVVSRLFDIVQPHKAFFGLKDYQQVMVIKKMVEQLHLKTEIVPCPILREADGLAMSSRNMLLSGEERKAASLIPELMKEAKALAGTVSPVELKERLIAEASKNPLLKADYIEFREADTLKEVHDFSADKKIICLAAIYSGKIRLIDNILIS